MMGGLEKMMEWRDMGGKEGEEVEIIEGKREGVV